MSAAIPPKLQTILDGAYYAWLTTTREDGQPQPTPIWFIQDGDTFVIYSQPDAQKIKNIRANGKVALSYNSDHEAEYFVVVMGDAVVDESIPSPIQNEAYFKKYEKGIGDIGMTPDSFEKTFSLAIRVTPTRVRGNSG